MVCGAWRDGGTQHVHHRSELSLCYTAPWLKHVFHYIWNVVLEKSVVGFLNMYFEDCNMALKHASKKQMLRVQSDKYSQLYLVMISVLNFYCRWHRLSLRLVCLDRFMVYFTQSSVLGWRTVERAFFFFFIIFYSPFCFLFFELKLFKGTFTRQQYD